VAEEYSKDGGRAHSQWSSAKATPTNKDHAISFYAEVLFPE